MHGWPFAMGALPDVLLELLPPEEEVVPVVPVVPVPVAGVVEDITFLWVIG